MEMANPVSAFKLCLVIFIAVALVHITNANTLNMQAEYLMGFPLSRIRTRTNAVNQKTVWLKDLQDTVTWTFCTDAYLSMRVLAVRYSMDAWQKTVAISLDNAEIGTFSAQNSSNGGNNWNTFLTTSTPLSALQSITPGSHVLSLILRNVTVAFDVYGLEIDQITVGFSNEVTFESLICSAQVDNADCAED